MRMKRRDFIKAVTAGVILSGVDPFPLVFANQLLPQSQGLSQSSFDSYIKDYLHKMQNFDQPHQEDIFIEKELLPVLRSCVSRLKRVEQTVGHGNFYLLSFDEGLKIARNYPEVGEFTKAELDFFERTFYTDSSLYGFIGDKPIDIMTYRINENDAVKIPATGNYLYRGMPHEMYEKLKKNVGDKLYLTSGIRGVVKQFLLFLDKADSNRGNLSLASRSLAPPGYSFHGIADFDVGQMGYGILNFTGSFTRTEVFKKLEDLDYVSLRYTKDNLKGVRFEPWHIKVFPNG
jgi:D-alanyl-D-alanine carboxypeptidase